jgi:acetyl-CoA synthetase
MADTATTPSGEETLEAKLEGMLEIEKFEPPEDFRKDALLSDASVYEEAESDWKGWWLK